MQRKKLPIGIQTFSEIISKNYCYVDKTAIISKLVTCGKYNFLSRPRRFGKSLLVSTLKSLFAGEQGLFVGLAIEPEWDWSRSHPVIHISFGGGLMNSPEVLENILQSQMREHAEDYQIILTETLASTQFRQLIRLLHAKFNQQIVLLIDEYDKPILDNIVSNRDEVAIAVSDMLKGFYAVIKDSDAYLRFVLLTGVSKFSKVSLFSGLNNLEDITLLPDVASLCGYTQSELEHTFAAWLDGVNMDKLRLWYNGYNFAAPNEKYKVYNPFDVLLYLKNRQFESYWFETGSPSFLVRLLQKRRVSALKLEKIHVSTALLSSFDVNAIEPEALLFQTGYLTIKRKIMRGSMIAYELDFPNFEVRTAFNDAFLRCLGQDASAQNENSFKLYDALLANDVNALRKIFHAFFASIPYEWYRKNQLANYEGYYCSIVYCYFTALGIEVIAEDMTSTGRIDLTAKLEGKVFILEFKVVEQAGEGKALQQIIDKDYARKYANADEIWLLGVEFSSENRNIVGFEYKNYHSA